MTLHILVDFSSFFFQIVLLNYKKDGTPFWNQFFVAALKDGDGAVVNYVGVQCEVKMDWLLE
jgi:hypothetical protein